MLLPGLLAVGYLLITKEGFRTIDWGIKKPSYLFYAVIIPAALALLSMLLIGALRIGTSTHFAFTAGSLDSFEPFFDVLTSQIGKYCAFYAHKLFFNNP